MVFVKTSRNSYNKYLESCTRVFIKQNTLQSPANAQYYSCEIIFLYIYEASAQIIHLLNWKKDFTQQEFEVRWNTSNHVHVFL